MSPLDRLLDAVVSRAGIVLLTLLIAAGGMAGHAKLQRVVAGVEGARSVFDRPGLRDGMSALTDLSYLDRVVQEARLTGEISTGQRFLFRRYVILLEEHVAGFRQKFEGAPSDLALTTAQSTLGIALEAAQQVSSSDFAELDTATAVLLSNSDRARSAIIEFIDNSRMHQSEAARQQSELLDTFVGVSVGGMAIMGAIWLAMVLLVRRAIHAKRLRREAESKADFLAYNDPLTGLPNLIGFREILRKRLRGGDTLVLAIANLDGFKAVNQIHGQRIGDEVLREVAFRLDTRIKAHGGMTARLSADEFAVIFPYGSHGEVRGLARFLLRDACRPIVRQQVSVEVGLTIGIAASPVVEALRPVTADALCAAADLALRDGKLHARGGIVLYDADLEAKYSDRRNLLLAIPAALRQHEFFVVYQPKIDLATGRVYGFEALIRWLRDGATVSPADFLPLAEEARLILGLDYFVLREAATQLVAWNIGRCEPLTISVNLSALHFEDDAVLDELAAVLRDTGLDPRLLVLEITETVLLDDWPRVKRILEAFRAIGVRVSLDDFGTGYSSLAYLRRIAADELKIDRAFVTELEQSHEARFILDAIVDIAGGLGMTIVVEGIETAAQSQIVQSFGCRHGQGYFFGAPMTAADIDARVLATGPARKIA